MGVEIVSTGRYSPSNILTNDDLSKIVDTNDEWIVERTGIKKRHISENETTEDMAVFSCKSALEKIDIDVDDIGIVIFSSVSSDTITPASAYVISSRLGIKNAICMDINAACSGFVYGVSTATALLKEMKKKYALVIGAERLSKFINWDDRSTCILFGDGAGCVVIKNSTLVDDRADLSLEVVGMVLGSKFDEKGYLTIDSRKKITDKSRLFIEMNGRQVYKFATDIGPRIIDDLIKQENIPKDEISLVVAHQANIRIIKTMAEKSKIDIKKWYTNMESYGNTSSASVPLAFDEVLEKIKDEGNYEKYRGTYIISLAFGGGFSYGGVVFKVR